MKKSLWLQEYEKEVNGKRQKSNQSKKYIFLIIPIIFILFTQTSHKDLWEKGLKNKQISS